MRCMYVLTFDVPSGVLARCVIVHALLPVLPIWKKDGFVVSSLLMFVLIIGLHSQGNKT